MKRIGKVLLIVFVVIIAAGLYLFAADALYVNSDGIHFEMDNIFAKVYVRATDTEPTERNILYDLCPVGSVLAYMGSRDDIPEGWLLCDGSELPDEPKYQDLRRVLSSRFYQNGGPAFLLPDLRGLFLRGIIKEEDVQDPNISEEEYNAYNENRIKWLMPGMSDYIDGSQEDGIRTTEAETFSRGDNVNVPLQLYNDYEGHDWGTRYENGIACASDSVPIPEDNHEVFLTVGSALDTRPVNFGVNYIIKY